MLILGGGFGGAYCAKRLGRVADPLGIRITLIDRHNYFIFYPLLAEAGTGSLEPRHAVVSLRAMLGRHVEFVMAEVAAVDTDARRVTVRLTGTDVERPLEYDELVIALGSETMLPPVSGLAEHAFEMKTLADAVALRDRAIAMLEHANAIEDPDERRGLLEFAVVGGSYTGVEVAGEFDVFLREAARHYPNIDRREIRVHLIEAADRVLPTLDKDLADYATQKLRGRGVQVVLGRPVTAVHDDHVLLDDGTPIGARTCIWAAGIQPTPLTAELALPTDRRGYLLCDTHMRVEGCERVWAIGDCAINPDPDGRPYPATAQHASQMANALAKNIARKLSDRPTRPFVYKTRGTLAALGCRTAVAKVFGLKLSGFIAWWLWRTVYLMKMPGWGRRFRIALEWTADLFFRRDYVQLGVHRTRGTGADHDRRAQTQAHTRGMAESSA